MLFVSMDVQYIVLRGPMYGSYKNRRSYTQPSLDNTDILYTYTR